MKMPPRPYKSFDAPKPPSQAPNVTSLELKNLNNSSELRSAHDMMSNHLQKLIDEGKEGTEDVKIVKGLINDIKNKY